MTDTHAVVPQADVLKAKTELHPLVLAALGTDPTPETIEKLLGLQERWEANEAKRAFTQALVELQRAMPSVIDRDKTVDFQKQSGGSVHYTHASLAHVYNTVRPFLVEYGFSLTFRPSTQGDRVGVTAVLTHRLGHSQETTITAPPDTGGQKSGPQAVASTITLLQRYAALALLGIATADMTEPTGETVNAPDAVDSKRNLAVMGELAKLGKTKDACEAHAGRKIQQWTAADLEKLRAWAKPADAAKSKRDQLIETAKRNGWEEYQVKARLEEMGFKGAVPADKWETTLEYFAKNKPTAPQAGGDAE